MKNGNQVNSLIERYKEENKLSGESEFSQEKYADIDSNIKIPTLLNIVISEVLNKLEQQTKGVMSEQIVNKPKKK
jgi:hypothetical protein